MAVIVPRGPRPHIVAAMSRLTTTAVAQAERRLLCDLLAEVGPAAPTLCSGWSTRDLAAHLYVREREPLAAGGLVLPPLKRLLESRMAAAADKPWPELVAALRQGPPAPMAWFDGAANLVEFVVHREDVRRAVAEDAGVVATEDRDEPTRQVIWQRLCAAAGLMFRGLPVTLVWPGHAQVEVRRRHQPRVTVSGSPVDLLLSATGRAARVDVDGDPGAVSAFHQQRRGI